MATKKQKFVITEGMIQNASRYIPLARKIALIEVYAPDCLQAVEISTQKLQSDSILALPQLYEENILMKQLVFMQVFLTEYLHIQLQKGGVGEYDGFSAEQYDEFASSHPMNQLERLKTVSSVKDKVYDIIADFKDFKKLFDLKIFNLKAAHNDGIERALAGISVINDPETMKKIVEELKKAVPPKRAAKKPTDRLPSKKTRAKTETSPAQAEQKEQEEQKEPKAEE